MNADEFREQYEDAESHTVFGHTYAKLQVLALGIEEILRRLEEIENNQEKVKSRIGIWD